MPWTRPRAIRHLCSVEAISVEAISFVVASPSWNHIAGGFDCCDDQGRPVLAAIGANGYAVNPPHRYLLSLASQILRSGSCQRSLRLNIENPTPENPTPPVAHTPTLAHDRRAKAKRYAKGNVRNIEVLLLVPDSIESEPTWNRPGS